MPRYIDFNEVKAAISIERAADLLNLQLSPSGNHQMRGPCPACQSGDRTLVITPSKNLFYCFKSQQGGDQIALAAHVLGKKANEAATFLVEQGTETSTSTVSKGRANSEPQNQKGGDNRPRSGCPELDYLQADHAAVGAIGLDRATAQAIGAGYANKGLMRGTVAIPIRLPDGTLCGYVGLTEIAKLPPKFFLTADNVVIFKKPA